MGVAARASACEENAGDGNRDSGGGGKGASWSAGLLGNTDLEAAKDNCEKNWQQHKDVETVIKALEGLAKLPAGNLNI